MSSPYEELYDFLLAAFSKSDLPRFVRNYLDLGTPERRDFSATIANESLSPAEFADAFIDIVLERKQPTIPEFKQALLDERPGRSKDIEEVFSRDPLRRNKLISLMTSLFNMHGLRSFVRFKLKRPKYLDDIVRTGLFTSALKQMHHHDMIDDVFWEALKEERPKRVAEIEGIQARWLAAPETPAPPEEEEETQEDQQDQAETGATPLPKKKKEKNL